MFECSLRVRPVTALSSPIAEVPSVAEYEEGSEGPPQTSTRERRIGEALRGAWGASTSKATAFDECAPTPALDEILDSLIEYGREDDEKQDEGEATAHSTT